MASEYLKRKYRDVKPEEKRELTPEEKRKNWWRYHWHFVLLGAAALAVLCGVVWEHMSRKEADCSVALVVRFTPTSGEIAALQEALEAVCPDSNGDGEVHVAVNAIRIDYTSTDLDDAAVMDMTANVDKLNADFYTCQSGVFLLDDPANFQANHGALAYPDGSTPPEGDLDWTAMALPWDQCPAVAEVAFSGTGADGLWFARRIADSDRDRTALAGAVSLWERLFPAYS